MDFLEEDFSKLLDSMKSGAERIRDLIVSLRNFSRLDESQLKLVDIHEGLESTLLLLQNKLNSKKRPQGISLIKEYGDLPRVECYPGQLNQVFLNLLNNAIEALESLVNSQEWSVAVENETEQLSTSETQSPIPTIKIKTEFAAVSQKIIIKILDNGEGMTETVMKRLFDPFFTTKPVGKGSGLGLSISYQIIVENHGGNLSCISRLGEGTEFKIEIPLKQNTNKDS